MTAVARVQASMWEQRNILRASGKRKGFIGNPPSPPKKKRIHPGLLRVNFAEDEIPEREKS